MSEPTQNVPLTQLSVDELCKVRIHTILDKKITCYEEPIATFLEDDYKLSNAPSRGLRWIHLPINNMSWAERCINKCGPDYRMQPLHWLLSVRPALSEPIKIPLHSRHMELKCRWRADDGDQSVNIQFPLCTVYLPYMNWDEYRQYRSLAKVYDCVRSGEPLGPLQDSASQREVIEHRTSQFLLGMNGKSLHPRRTLDQFYYSSLDDTSSRDRDQTISKWTGPDVGADGRTAAIDQSLIIMVDQLWCWVVDERTVFTCFPSQNTHYQGPETHGLRDLYKLLRFSTNTCETVWDLHAAIIEQATTHLHSQWNRGLIDYIEIYRWATSKKTAYLAMYFQDFHQDYSNGNAAFDNNRELNLALEVADIIDELKMIKNLLEKQRIVVGSLKSGFNNLGLMAHSQAYKHIACTERHLESVLSNVNEIKGEAEETYRSLLDLLDLKSKTASLAEARSTTKQGQAVMLFTVVTIIFLPLSFFTAYFGQNVSEITGDDANPTAWELWRVGTPITVVIVLVALLIAYHIMRPNSRLWFWKQSSHSAHMRREDIEMGTR
ncbi:hypothetical protein BU25DRAFT_493335 [Macroventuria anomochaeta]|uniref:Uncharacterized protein n=1 Tax=Macroventuria anomochaeta TaxID=301207 RepID=A0ACB6RTQ7_9PLEO|nr:uncharacterized protein BU25DRAFT_493335 [Macroventuria anomochaeta]KAF2624672.1 hypothetical protein BU25DRAFT_493335 [Macroventuria anomochaeta]